jgi:hypothetical protein
VQKENNPPKKAQAPINRFALLNIDGAVDDSSSDEDSELDMLGFHKDFCNGLNGVAV